MDAILKWGSYQPQTDDLRMGTFPKDKKNENFFHSGIRNLFMMVH